MALKCALCDKDASSFSGFCSRHAPKVPDRSTFGYAGGSDSKQGRGADTGSGAGKQGMAVEDEDDGSDWGKQGRGADTGCGTGKAGMAVEDDGSDWRKQGRSADTASGTGKTGMAVEDED
jgi:hypothetical protein